MRIARTFGGVVVVAVILCVSGAFFFLYVLKQLASFSIGDYGYD